MAKVKSESPAKARIKSSRVTLAAAGKAPKLAFDVSMRTMNALAKRKTDVRAVMKAMGDTIADSSRFKAARAFRVLIDADGKTHIDLEPDFEIGAPATIKLGGLVRLEQVAEPTTPDLLEAARGRGRILAAQILAQDDMLSADEMGTRLGVSRVTINERRSRNELLGLDGAKRGFRFPEWQVDNDGKAIALLPRLFELLGPSPWTIYRFLTQRHDALGGRAAKDALAEGDEAAVLEAAESLARGEFS